MIRKDVASALPSTHSRASLMTSESSPGVRHCTPQRWLLPLVSSSCRFPVSIVSDAHRHQLRHARVSVQQSTLVQLSPVIDLVCIHTVCARHRRHRCAGYASAQRLAASPALSASDASPRACHCGPALHASVHS